MTVPQVVRKAMHVHSPLIHSQPLTDQAGHEVFLKLDNTQPSGSFKIRGHGNLCAKAVAMGATSLVSSSGGNAGAAVAYAGQQLGVQVTIVVPITTPEFMVRRLERNGAEVIVHGNVWDEADAHSRTIVESLPPRTAVHVSPFDHPDLWEGISSLPEELVVDLGGRKPGAVVVSVGGGGLFLGVAEGLEKVGWGDVPIICAETDGANSFAAMFQAGGKLVSIKEVTSIAKSLGTLAVSKKCSEWIKSGRPLQSVVVSDKEAVEACSALAVHHRFLVEPACGAAIAAVCSPKHAGKHAHTIDGPIVIVVCGGNMASPTLLDSWIKTTGATPSSL